LSFLLMLIASTQITHRQARSSPLFSLTKKN
jgi:hypothetical protein